MKTKYRFLSFFFILSVLYSCNPYKKVSVTNDELYNMRRLASSYKKYVILTHDPSNDTTAYRLENVEFTQDSIIADVKIVSTVIPESVSPEKNKELMRTVDLHLRQDDEVKNYLIDSNKIVLPKSKVQKVEMYAKKRRGVLGVVGTVLLIVGLVIVALILLLIILILVAADGSGGSTSGGSNSGGGGGGGGGNSGSSCYIATMVYGSSESAEVLVLRSFRDRMLLNNAPGRAFVKWYYQNSPHFVEQYKNHTMVNRMVKVILTPLVWTLRIFQKS